ncbi:MAG: DUF2303 family protein [Pseudomonadota bacterium]
MEDFIKKTMAAAVGISLVQSTGALAPLAAIPEGVSLKSLEGYMPAPNRITGAVNLHRYNDFVEYINAFKQDGARIFVKPDLVFTSGGELAKAVLDYPLPGKPAWSTHLANFIVSPSLEYQMLTALEQRGLIDQSDFALALRDIARFCTSLSAADLVEIAQTLTLQSKGQFASVEDNFSGSVRFGYDIQVKATSDATARKSIEVPTELGFNMPVLQGGEPTDLVVELLYRVPSDPNGKVRMAIRIQDRKFIERAVLEQTADKLQAATSVTVSVGSTNVPTSPDE